MNDHNLLMKGIDGYSDEDSTDERSRNTFCWQKRASRTPCPYPALEYERKMKLKLEEKEKARQRFEEEEILLKEAKEKEEDGFIENVDEDQVVAELLGKYTTLYDYD